MAGSEWVCPSGAPFPACCASRGVLPSSRVVTCLRIDSLRFHCGSCNGKPLRCTAQLQMLERRGFDHGLVSVVVTGLVSVSRAVSSTLLTDNTVDRLMVSRS